MNSKKASERLARQLNQVRQKKVEKLKAQIVTGQYQVNNSAVARSLFFSK